jgi:hypothetical protein
VLLLSLPEAMKLGGMGRTVLKVVKNRLVRPERACSSRL